MIDELEFRNLAETALNALLQHLIAHEEAEDAGFEVEGGQGGLIHVLFDDPPGKFVITPNAPVQQIWISALSTSFKLDWDPVEQAFVLPRTGEQLTPLMDRLIAEHLQG
jgi:iron donor protein CyaY